VPQYTPQYTAILRTSTRVLMALAERQKPADKDVAKLQRFAPQHAHEDIYVLAYYVSQEALQKRRESRAARQMINQNDAPAVPQERRGRIAGAVSP
jgi:hypothetical protein